MAYGTHFLSITVEATNNITEPWMVTNIGSDPSVIGILRLFEVGELPLPIGLNPPHKKYTISGPITIYDDSGFDGIDVNWDESTISVSPDKT